MDTARDSWLEAVLDVVVHSQVAFNQVSEILNDFSTVLVQKSLELGDIFKLIEMLLELSIEVLEDAKILVQDLNQLIGLHLI